jgi:hypothetical protein
MRPPPPRPPRPARVFRSPPPHRVLPPAVPGGPRALLGRPVASTSSSFGLLSFFHMFLEVGNGEQFLCAIGLHIMRCCWTTPKRGAFDHQFIPFARDGAPPRYRYLLAFFHGFDDSRIVKAFHSFHRSRYEQNLEELLGGSIHRRLFSAMRRKRSTIRLRMSTLSPPEFFLLLLATHFICLLNKNNDHGEGVVASPRRMFVRDDDDHGSNKKKRPSVARIFLVECAYQRLPHESICDSIA